MRTDYHHLRPSLVAKIDYSIDLLRKAEQLAMKYNSTEGYYLAFSGGKDSQCLYHVAQLAGVKFRAHMNFTSIDPPEVVRFVRRNYPDVVCHKPVDSIYNIAVKRKLLLPSRIMRWCCAELKEKSGAGMVVLTGIRHEESSRRSKRKSVEVSNRSFAGDLDGFEIYQREQISKKLRHINQDQFAQQGETEVRCINGKDKIIINPIIDWTDRDVWDFLNGMEIEHCELYDKGYKRIGCILCPMTGYKQKLKEMQDYPHVRRCWVNAIKRIRAEGILTKNHFGDGDETEICENIFDWWISGKVIPSGMPKGFYNGK